MKRSPALAALILLATLAVAGVGATRALAADLDPGPLDLPLPATDGDRSSGEGGATVDDLSPAPGVVDQRSLEREVRIEQEELETLDREALEERAEAGERGAQVALGADYAREAESLAFAPAAANDALSDAVYWYSLAASRGFPGAPSLDQAGVSFYPIRIQRPRP